MIIKFNEDNNKYQLSGTDDEIRRIQKLFQKINKDPEKFLKRPESEKEGINYRKNQTCDSWTIDLGQHVDIEPSSIDFETLSDSDILRLVNTVSVIDYLSDRDRELVTDDYLGCKHFEDLKRSTQERIEEYIGSGEVDVEESIDIDNVIDEAIGTGRFSLPDLLERFCQIKGTDKFDEEFSKCIDSDDAVRVLHKSNNIKKSDIAEEFNIGIEDINVSKAEAIQKLGINILDVLKVWIGKA